jgi:hypothetical protein
MLHISQIFEDGTFKYLQLTTTSITTTTKYYFFYDFPFSKKIDALLWYFNNPRF